MSGTNVIWQSADSDSLQAVTRLSGTVWGVAGVGDFNGDNKADILWRNSNTGYNTIWLSANSSTGQAVTGVGGQDWQIVGFKLCLPDLDPLADRTGYGAENSAPWRFQASNPAGGGQFHPALVFP